MPTRSPAAEVAPAAKLSPDGRAVLAAGQTAADYLTALLAAGHTEDAVRLVAHALPPREAVWWATRCARQGPAEPPDDAAGKAAEAWCGRPTDANRRAAHAAGQAAAESPLGLAALACFFADGSIAPADCPAVPPPPGACAALAAGAVLIAAVKVEPEKADERRAAFAELGRAVADGKDRWPDAVTPLPVPPTPVPPPEAKKPPRPKSYY